MPMVAKRVGICVYNLDLKSVQRMSDVGKHSRPERKVRELM